MKKLLALFLIFPIFISAEEQTFEECIAVADSERDRASEAYEACLTEFEVEDRDSCATAYIETSGYTEEDAFYKCVSVEIRYQYSLFMDDRPTEFFDIYDAKDIDPNIKIRSYACTIPTNDEGLELNNALLVEFDENNEVIDEVWVPYKVIIHMIPELNYTEINFGETIFPLTQFRFFTNTYYHADDKYGGYVDIDSDIELKGGTDRGEGGFSWVVNETDNTVVMIVANYDIMFIADCGWSEDRMKELDEDLE